MARSRNLRPWALALWGLCVLAAIGAQPGGGDQGRSDSTTPVAVGGLSADPAVLPARAPDEVRVATPGSPLRLLALAVVLAAVGGLPVALRRMSSAGDRDHQQLRSRRYAIALRAPPLQLA